MAESDPAALADILMHFNNILMARGWDPQKLADATCLDISLIEETLLPSNPKPDLDVLSKFMLVAHFDIKNWQNTKKSLEKIITKYDEVLRKLSKT